MKVSKFFAAIFGLLGLAVAGFGIWVSFTYMNAGPVLVQQPESAVQRIDEMMDAVCANDYAGASGYIFGNPDFGADREPEDAVSKLIWDAFVSSIGYELNGELYATDSGVAQDITVTTLDISSVTGTLKDRSTVLLEQRVAEAEDPHEVYDENNEYREDFVMQVLLDAAKQALEEDASTVSQSVTINMIFEDGQWWILADSQLFAAISGGVVK